jgi:hypothetical protein
MKQVQLFQNCIKVAALFAILLTAYKCAAQQPIRVQTAPGLIEITESADPDEICIRFGEKAGEVKAEHLRHAGLTIARKISAAARMANDAGVPYHIFLRENEVSDTRHIRQYFDNCHALRRQFLALMPERVFLEFQHQIQYF